MPRKLFIIDKIYHLLDDHKKFQYRWQLLQGRKMAWNARPCHGLLASFKTVLFVNMQGKFGTSNCISSRSRPNAHSALDKWYMTSTLSHTYSIILFTCLTYSVGSNTEIKNIGHRLPFVWVIGTKNCTRTRILILQISNGLY